MLTPTPEPVTVAAPMRVMVEEEGLNLSLKEGLRSELVMRGMGWEMMLWGIFEGEGGGLMLCFRSVEELVALLELPTMREEKSLFILEVDSFLMAVGEVWCAGGGGGGGSGGTGVLDVVEFETGEDWRRSRGVMVAVELLAEMLPRLTEEADASKCFSRMDLGITAFAAEILDEEGPGGDLGLGAVRFFATTEACMAAWAATICAVICCGDG